MGTNFEKDFKRGALALATLGTSEIKTGGGEYGDETLADSLFPKTVNNWALEDRQAARNKTDADKAAAEEKARPGPPPDMTDRLLMQARRSNGLRLMTGASDRNNSFGGGF